MVSIIIPTYKRPNKLIRAIESCLTQSYKNIEIVVVDDNTDGDEFRTQTEELMLKFQNDSKVKYIKHHTNQNGSAARNTGIKNSVGDYITFLDDDDVIAPTKIERQVEFLESHGDDYGVVCTGVNIYDEKRKK